MERQSFTPSHQQCDAPASLQAISTRGKQLPNFLLLYSMEYSMVRLGQKSWPCIFPPSWPPPYLLAVGAEWETEKALTLLSDKWYLVHDLFSTLSWSWTQNIALAAMKEINSFPAQPLPASLWVMDRKEA